MLSQPELQQVFTENTRGGRIPGANHWTYGRQWIGKPFSWIVSDGGQLAYHSSEPSFDLDVVGDYPNILARIKGNPFSGLRFKRLDAERSIVPEADNPERSVRSSGAGATNLIQHFINKVDLPRRMVEQVLLSALNEIFDPDGAFIDIVIEQDAQGIWEIHLAEEHKGHVPLSHTGSGIKTILLVLIYLHLVPVIEKCDLSKYLFGFEELENNLHPALQRRLLLYLRRTALEKGCRFFLTTHSSVAIDVFSNDEEAQVIHVTHDRTSATVKKVVTYVDNRGVLDDLDIRASDLLQANGVVWLEGPSDRLYFNRWMELISNGSIREGAHYQCVFYGGRLLAHLSAADPTVDANDVVRILRVNRNAILIVDSDKATAKQEINDTKKRLLEEIRALGAFPWLTAGREVENYIPNDVLETLYPAKPLPRRNAYSDFANTLESIRHGEGKRFVRNKVLFAEKVLPHLSTENLSQTLDWDHRASAALAAIEIWNGLRHSGR
jgi:hypothetical protein